MKRTGIKTITAFLLSVIIALSMFGGVVMAEENADPGYHPVDAYVINFSGADLEELLKDYEDIEVVATFPLPVCNSMAVMELKESGVDRVLGHIELDCKEDEKCADAPHKHSLPTAVLEQKKYILVKNFHMSILLFCFLCNYITN